LADRPSPPPQSGDPPEWQKIATLLNKVLGNSWPSPQYTCEQAAKLPMCLALVVDKE